MKAERVREPAAMTAPGHDYNVAWGPVLGNAQYHNQGRSNVCPGSHSATQGA